MPNSQANTASEDPTEALFDSQHVLAVELEIPDEEWQALRRQGRQTASTLSACTDPEFSYDYFRATVTIDGETVEEVDVRKKGFIGSLSLIRPSLKLNFGRGPAAGRTFHGAKRITLNNNSQDSSNLRQCMFYAFADAAGLISPRCAFADVTVNQDSLGTYTHVEAIKKPFLARNFDSDDGNLYEGQIADFSAQLEDRFELKTNNDESDRSDLDRVNRALDASDNDLLERLAGVIDVDEYFTFWAAEVLAGHWDGMTGNQNNYYVYHDPTDDLFHPIPWGADAAFRAGSPFATSGAPSAVLAANAISARLYAIPQARQRLHDKLRWLLDRVWDEEALLDEAARIAVLTDSPAKAVAQVTEFIEGRRKVVLAELAQNDGTGLDAPLLTAPTQCIQPLPTEGTFNFVWTDEDSPMAAYAPLGAGELSHSIPLAPAGALELDAAPLLQAVYIDGNPEDGAVGFVRVGFLGFQGERQILVQFKIPGPLYKVGEIPFHGIEVSGMVLELVDEDPGFNILGMIADGAITLEEAGTAPGEPVRGSWTGKLVDFGRAQ